MGKGCWEGVGLWTIPWAFGVVAGPGGEICALTVEQPPGIRVGDMRQCLEQTLHLGVRSFGVWGWGMGGGGLGEWKGILETRDQGAKGGTGSEAH